MEGHIEQVLVLPTLLALPLGPSSGGVSPSFTIKCSTMKVISIEMTGIFIDWPMCHHGLYLNHLFVNWNWATCINAESFQQQQLMENDCDHISDSPFRRHVFFLQLAPPFSSAGDSWHILWHIYKWNTENQMFAKDKRKPRNKLIQFQFNRFPLQWMNSFLQ